MMTCPECGKPMMKGGTCKNCGYVDKGGQKGGRKPPMKKGGKKTPPAKKSGRKPPFGGRPY